MSRLPSGPRVVFPVLVVVLLLAAGTWGWKEAGRPRPVHGTGDTGRPAQPEEMAPMGKAAGKLPNDWFHVQRSWPGVEISPEARALALEQARVARAEAAAAGGRSRDPWQEAGPVNIGGRITAIAVHPSALQRFFVGAADGGVFRSTDAGASWEPVFDAVGSLSIGALAVDPSNPLVVYCGTGEANASGDSFAGLGLFRSTDAGDTWTPAGLGSSRHINRIVVDPTNPSRLYVAVMGGLFSKGPDRGLYRSTDGGESWERKLFVSDSTGVIDVVLDPTNPARIYAATWERLRSPKHRRVGGLTCGVYRSTDGGETWSLLGGGLPTPSVNVGRIGLALAASQSQTLYAIYADKDGYFAGLYKSTNGGDAWARTADGGLSDLYSSYGWYFGNVRVDPTNPNRVFTLGLDIYRSTTGGSGWTYVSNGVHVDQHDLWIDPTQSNHLVSGGDGGLYLSSNGGSSWTHVETLPISQFYAGAVDHLNPLRLYGGTQDNGTVRTWTGAADDWEMIYGGDGFYCLVDPRNSNVIFAEYQYGNLSKSNNGGGSFFSCLSGVNSSDRRNWSTPVVMDPSNPDRMYYGTYRLYRTTNAASSWSSISADLTGGSGDATLVYATLTTIAVAPSDGQVIYVGTDDARVWRTTNGGGAWQNLSVGLPPRWVTRVAVDPTNADLAYVAHSGYRLDSPLAHLHRTTNGGASWTPISAGLPEAPVNAFTLDPENPSILYAGTDVGVYVSPDAGQSWSELAAGLPITVIDDLVLHAPTRTLVAFTHGRSAYRLALPSAAEVASPAVAAATTRPRWLRVGPHPYTGGTARLEFEAPIGASPSIGLFDATGRLRRSWAEAAASRVVQFDGRDADGRRLPAGIYYLRLAVDGAIDSRPFTIL